MALIKTERRDAFLIVQMAGEGKFNPDSLREMNLALDQVESDKSIQGLVLIGTEKNFSQGLDLEYLMTQEPADFKQFVENCMVMVARLLCFPVPVVSAVNGHAFGLGAMIVMASDYGAMRRDRGYICLPEIDLGMDLVPSMNALVTSKLSRRALREMLLSGRRVGGEEAVELAVIDACGEQEQLLDQAMELAQPMLGKSRQYLPLLKRGLNLNCLSIIENGPGVRGD